MRRRAIVALLFCNRSLIVLLGLILTKLNKWDEVLMNKKYIVEKGRKQEESCM